MVVLLTKPVSGSKTANEKSNSKNSMNSRTKPVTTRPLKGDKIPKDEIKLFKNSNSLLQ